MFAMEIFAILFDGLLKVDEITENRALDIGLLQRITCEAKLT